MPGGQYVEIWHVSMCFTSLNMCIPEVYLDVKMARKAAGEPSPTWEPHGRIPDLAGKEQEALSKAKGVAKTSAAQRTP